MVVVGWGEGVKGWWGRGGCGGGEGVEGWGGGVVVVGAGRDGVGARGGRGGMGVVVVVCGGGRRRRGGVRVRNWILKIPALIPQIPV